MNKSIHTFSTFMNMKKRRIGNTELLVSPLAFGGNVLGWTIDEKRSFEILDQLLANEFNFIDTADVYARWATGQGGESETILGKWMKQRKNRSSVIIATKVGMDMGDGKIGLSKKYIMKAVDESLKRLQTDHIDLYQSHKDDEKTPLEETLDAYAQLIKEGKVRYIGASNYSAARLQEAMEVSKKFSLPRYECLQPHYNLCERALFEKDLEKTCLDHQISVIPYYALAAGFLSGKYRTPADSSKSVRGGGASRYLNEKGLGILKILDELAAKHEVKQPSVALAWLMARKSITAPIASSTSPQQLKELMQSVSLDLSASDIQLLDSASS
ncbi:MAG: alcohol dehydrogenase [Bacteroidetes bacterium]|jgi:aryl-alcohol dehydrogenase-like predicted oxidoreductase|nr:alcohol dehydrogenase [Bacteroidota bacterium]